jgi:hypothetical protein
MDEYLFGSRGWRDKAVAFFFIPVCDPSLGAPGHVNSLFIRVSSLPVFIVDRSCIQPP